MKKSTDILNLFNSIANKYDLLNNLISFGMHKLVKQRAIRNVPLKKGAETLDLCAGTGDIAAMLAENFRVTAVDFSENMLEIARKRNPGNIKFIQADVLQLPFEDDSFDAVFISFGLRNLESLDKGIAEMKRVVKHGGFVVNLDTGKPKGFIGKLFRFYFFNIVPLIGKIFVKNFAAYKYLPESTENFPPQEELVEIFKHAGFRVVRNYNFVFGAMAQQIAKL